MVDLLHQRIGKWGHLELSGGLRAAHRTNNPAEMPSCHNLVSPALWIATSALLGPGCWSILRTEGNETSLNNFFFFLSRLLILCGLHFKRRYTVRPASHFSIFSSEITFILFSLCGVFSAVFLPSEREVD